MEIAVIIPCFKRIDTLKELCNSLVAADYDGDKVTIVFSIDYSGDDTIEKYAKSFEWPYGCKRVICHTKNIGLRSNIISCGDLTEEYDAVIILEDDLEVMPSYYRFAKASALFYDKDDKIAGISIYQYRYEEITRNEFNPIYEGYDVYFMQWASSWGQLWTRNQWRSFKEWYLSHEDISDVKIPNDVIRWERSWKKYYIAYLTDTDRYFVFPYFSFVYNGDKRGGDHTTMKTNTVVFTSSYLNTGTNLIFKFPKLEDVKFKYDVFFQIEPQQFSDGRESIMVDYDLFGHKEHFKSNYVITSRTVDAKKTMNSYGCKMIPIELNISNSIPGTVFHLIRVEDVDIQSCIPFSSYVSLRRIMGAKQMLQNGFFKMYQRIKIILHL